MIGWMGCQERTRTITHGNLRGRAECAMVIGGACLLREGGMEGEDRLWMMVMEMRSLWLRLLWRKTRTTCEVFEGIFAARCYCRL